MHTRTWTVVLVIAACGSPSGDDGAESSDTSVGEGTSGSPTTTTAGTTAPTTTSGATTTTTTSVDESSDSGDDSSSSDTGHVVTPCDALGEPGTWEHITPAEVNLAQDFETPAGENYGV